MMDKYEDTMKKKEAKQTKRYTHFAAALGNLEKVRSDVRECVLWAFRYEDQPGVRAEACHTLIRLGLRDPEVATILQDRYLVEPNDVVRR